MIGECHTAFPIQVASVNSSRGLFEVDHLLLRTSGRRSATQGHGSATQGHGSETQGHGSETQGHGNRPETE